MEFGSLVTRTGNIAKAFVIEERTPPRMEGEPIPVPIKTDLTEARATALGNDGCQVFFLINKLNVLTHGITTTRAEFARQLFHSATFYGVYLHA